MSFETADDNTDRSLCRGQTDPSAGRTNTIRNPTSPSPPGSCPTDEVEEPQSEMRIRPCEVNIQYRLPSRDVYINETLEGYVSWTESQPAPGSPSRLPVIDFSPRQTKMTEDEIIIVIDAARQIARDSAPFLRPTIALQLAFDFDADIGEVTQIRRSLHTATDLQSTQSGQSNLADDLLAWSPPSASPQSDQEVRKAIDDELAVMGATTEAMQV